MPGDRRQIFFVQGVRDRADELLDVLGLSNSHNNHFRLKTRRGKIPERLIAGALHMGEGLNGPQPDYSRDAITE